MKSFCQFILKVLCLVLVGCSSTPDPRFHTDPTAVWFQSKAIRLTDLSGEPFHHLLFDPAASLDLKTGRVNFLPLGLAESEKVLEVDVLSGQRYFAYLNCPQNDVWRERSGVYGRPDYTLGVIPRHFDQLNQPQRIIVFGGTKRFDLKAPRVYQVRILGGFVEELCASGRCAGPKDWIGRMVLVAVDETDSSYGSIREFSQLRDKLDWPRVRAQLENLPGRNREADKVHPAIRVGNLLSTRETLEFLKKHTIAFSAKELASMQKSCGHLYQIMWDNVGKMTPLDRPARSRKEVTERAKFYESLKGKGKAAYFGERLSRAIEKYGTELATCARFVYAGDPNGAGERYVFQAWVNLFISLHKEGWFYNCQNQTWSTTNRGGEGLAEMKKYIAACTARDFDKAMENLPPFLKSLRDHGQRWRFVAWDEHTHGTHSKLQNWVRVPEKEFACSDDMNAKIRATWNEKAEGMEWVPRHSKGSRFDSEYIY